MGKELRVEFSAKIKGLLSNATDHLCSLCLSSTLCEGIDYGIAAHIYGATTYGPRGTRAVKASELGTLENGIWLCPNCHAVVDGCPDAFPVDRLFSLKKEAEEDVTYYDQGLESDVISCSRKPALVLDKKPLDAKEGFSFIGRLGDLRRLQRRIKQSSAAINIFGVSGIGKSSLCERLYLEAIESGIAGVDAICWIRYDIDIASSFYGKLNTIENAGFECVSPMRYFELVEKEARQRSSKLLIIVDGADGMSFQDLAALLSLKCRLVISSCAPLGVKFRPHELFPLSPYESTLLYEAHCDNAADRGNVEQISETLGYHPKLIETVSSWAHANSLSPKEVIDYLEDYRGNTLGKTMGTEEKSLDNIALSLAGLIGSTLNSNEVRLLSLLSLLNGSVISRDTVKCLGFDTDEVIASLQSKGLLTVRVRLSEHLLDVHQIIAFAVQASLEIPLGEDIVAFGRSLINQLMLFDNGDVTKQLSVLPAALAFTLGLLRLGYGYVDLHYYIAAVLDEIGDYLSSLDYYESALFLAERVLDADSACFGRIHNNISIVFDNLGSYEQCIYHLERALDNKLKHIREPNGLDSLATTILNLSITQEMHGAIDEAKGNAFYALEILTRLYGGNGYRTQNAMRAYANILRDTGEQNMALNHYDEALKNYRIHLGSATEKNVDTAYVYSDIGLLKYMAGDYEESLRYYSLCKDIWGATHGKNHQNYALVDFAVANVYKERGDIKSAKQHYRKALKVFSSLGNGCHPKRAQCCTALADILDASGRHSAAQKKRREAQKIKNIDIKAGKVTALVKAGITFIII
jgi:tetratricopeptide (TPR) repeat protein